MTRGVPLQSGLILLIILFLGERFATPENINEHMRSSKVLPSVYLSVHETSCLNRPQRKGSKESLSVGQQYYYFALEWQKKSRSACFSPVCSPYSTLHPINSRLLGSTCIRQTLRIPYILELVDIQSK